MNHDRQTDATGEVLVPCPELSGMESFFTDVLQFRLDGTFPADNPRESVLSGFGLRVRLVLSDDPPPHLRLFGPEAASIGDGATELTAPNGMRVSLSSEAASVTVPPLSAANSSVDAASDWVQGRAGMLYRDLVPSRLGGHVIASHIRIPDGGPVPDYVHYHHVQFQVIFCHRGWVRVVYEDAGEPLVLRDGDAVLQPPHIRHRVLESSAGLEVVEVSCPAEHATWVDHELKLPTPLNRSRRFRDQRFLHHRAADIAWQTGDGYRTKASEMGEASGGLVQLRTLRIEHDGRWESDSLARLTFVREGGLTVVCNGASKSVGRDEAFVVLPHTEATWTQVEPDTELLEVAWIPSV